VTAPSALPPSSSPINDALLAHLYTDIFRLFGGQMRHYHLADASLPAIQPTRSRTPVTRCSLLPAA